MIILKHMNRYSYVFLFGNGGDIMNNDDYKMKNVPVCQIDCIHEELVEEIKKKYQKMKFCTI